MRESNLFSKHALIYFLYVGLTFIFIYPVYLHYDTTSQIGDPLDIIWHLIWSYDHLLKNPSHLFDGNIFYPAKYSFIFTDHMIGTLIIFAPAYFLTKNPVLSHNILMFFLTILSGISMYSLFYYWTKKRLASFFSGFIFAFSPIFLYHYANLPSVCYIPLCMVFLDRFLKKGKLRDVILFSLIFSIIALSSMYFGYAIAITTFVYLIRYYFKVNKVYNRLFFIYSFIGIVIIMLLVLPFRLPYFKLKKEYGYTRKLGEMVQYSGDPIGSYFSCKTRLYNFDQQSFIIKSKLPGEEWLFGKVVSILGDKLPTGIEKLPGETFDEKVSYSRFQDIWKSGRRRNLFFGFVSLFLSFLGIYYMGKYLGGRFRNIRGIYIYILLTFYIISLGPVLVIFGHITYIPLPDLLFYYIIPGFSSMRRVVDFGIVVFMILTFFAGFGVLKIEDWIEKKYNKPYKIKIFVFSAIFLLTTAEIINIPIKGINPIRAGVNIPDVYKWLSKAGIEGAVAELPTAKGYYDKYDQVYGEQRVIYAFREITYMYYSVYHKKPIINGWGALTPDSFFKIRDQLYSIPDSSAVIYLKSLNINTFILHTSDFDPEDVKVWTDENIKKAGLKEVARFGDDIVLQFSY